MLMQIVNKNDEVIGLKSWEEFDLNRDIYRVSSLWLTTHDGKIILSQRGFVTNNQPGRWSPAVAGTLEDDDTYYSNIVRETEEEIGLKNITFTTGPKLFQKDGDRRFFLQWYTAILDAPLNSLTLDPDEVAAVRAIDPKSLRIDVSKNPQNYIRPMSEIVDLFC